MPLTEEQLAQFPEKVREWDEVKNSDNPEVVWDRLGNMRSKFGQALFKPGEDAGEEGTKKFLEKAVELSDGNLIPRPDLEDEDQRNALYKALGRPEDATGYEFEEIEGYDLNDDRKAFLGKVAHETGLTKAQLKKFDKELRSAEAAVLTEQLESHNKDLKDLRGEWGLAYDEKEHAAKKIAKIFFPHIPEDNKFSAAELKAFSSLAKQLGQNSKEFQDHDNNNPDLLTPADASTQIAEIRANPKSPYYDQTSPGHAAAKAKMRRLYRIKNGLPPEE